MMSSGRSSASGPSPILYESEDKRVVVLDIPRSIEASQTPSIPGRTSPLPSRRRLVSAQPVARPFETPEPRDGGGGAAIARSPAAQIADLMTTAAVDHALQQVRADRYDGPWCLPRVTAREAHVSTDAPAGGGRVAAQQDRRQDDILLIPEGTEYLQGPIQDLAQTFSDTAPKAFNLILLDPPWPNRSVRRKNKGKGSTGPYYSTTADLDAMRRLLAAIPVPAHLAPSGLVAVWITNKPAVLDLLTADPGGFLATAWGLELVAEWIWVKVTAATGEPVYPVDSAWRKPWEKLLIAKKRGSPTPPGLLASPKVILAVPDLHSRKPNLRAPFEEILGSGFLGLEVFARHLTAGWWSWGDDVLRFQGVEHWVEENHVSPVGAHKVRME